MLAASNRVGCDGRSVVGGEGASDLKGLPMLKNGTNSRNGPSSSVEPLASLARDLLPFPTRAMTPTEHFEILVPRSIDDQVVGIDFFSPDEAAIVQPQSDQTLLFAPDGSAFLFRIGPRPVRSTSSSTGF